MINGYETEELVRMRLLRDYSDVAIFGAFNNKNNIPDFEVDLFLPNEGVLFEIKHKHNIHAGRNKHFHGFDKAVKQVTCAADKLTNRGFIVTARVIIIVCENRTDNVTWETFLKPGLQVLRVQLSELNNWF